MGAWPWRPPLPPSWARPPHAACQRYLDEAEREKQQYMKELRAYQQSEAYKMCTEKIQEKKIKKGGKGPSLQAAECLLTDGRLRQAIPHHGAHTVGRGGGGVPSRGNTTCKAKLGQRRPGRLTLPSLLPHQRTPAPGS